jgi:Uncharacterised nucleotidyltransferase
VTAVRSFTPSERAWLVAVLGALGRAQPVPPAPTGLDWEGLVDAADAEDLGPALTHALGTLGFTGVPPAVRHRLTELLAASRARQLVMLRELGPVLRRCAADGVAVIVFKGPALAERVYPEPALRPFSDLDLLVRPADRFRMDDTLRALGHRRLADEHSWDFDVAYDGATVYETAAGVRIDLHWSLLTEPRFAWRGDETEVWARAEPIVVAGEAALGLGREDLVLHLAAHLAVHHTLTGLLRYWDVALVLERWGAELDWPALVARAERWGLRHALFFVLRGARDTFAAPVPPAVLQALRPAGPRAALLATLVRGRDTLSLVRLEHLVTLLLVDRGRDLYGPLRHAVWPSADWMRARYGTGAASRPTLYRAHLRRLGGVVGGAAAALVRGR